MSKLKICAISDTHNRYNKIVIPECDILIDCGDYSFKGYDSEIKNFYKWFNKQPAKYKISIQGNHECLDKKTELLTERGWLTYDKIRSNDRILSINDKQQSVWTDINKIYIDKAEYIYTYQNSAIDMAITENHRILYYNKQIKETNKLNYTTFQSMQYSIAIPCAKLNNNIDLNISDEFIKLLGWILTDGSVTKNDCYIYQSKIQYINNIKNILNELKFDYSLNIRNREIETICGKPIKQCLPQNVFRIKNSHTKQIRNFIENKKIINKSMFMKLSARQLKILINSMMDGDGSWYKTRTCGALNGAFDFLNWVQQLTAQSGIRSSLVEYRPGNFRLNLAFNNENIDIKGLKNQFEKKAYNDIVWCLSVPYTNFLVRRNGKAYFTGNCGWEADENKCKAIAKEHCPDVILLHDELVTVDDVKIYGSAFTPFFFNWAFNAGRTISEAAHYQKPFIGDIVAKIPENVDVLVTHGPPYNILDELRYIDGTPKGQFVGCVELRKRIEQIKPLVHVFGHIHSAVGEHHENGTSFYNVSICDEMYMPSNPVRIIELDKSELK